MATADEEMEVRVWCLCLCAYMYEKIMCIIHAHTFTHTTHTQHTHTHSLTHLLTNVYMCSILTYKSVTFPTFPPLLSGSSTLMWWCLFSWKRWQWRTSAHSMLFARRGVVAVRERQIAGAGAVLLSLMKNHKVTLSVNPSYATITRSQVFSTICSV